LITKLDPRLHEELGRRGFQVTGYRLELVGYETSLAAGTVHPDPVEPAKPAHDLAATKLPASGAANP
jgi:hypothetical protein